MGIAKSVLQMQQKETIISCGTMGHFAKDCNNKNAKKTMFGGNMDYYQLEDQGAYLASMWNMRTCTEWNKRWFSLVQEHQEANMEWDTMSKDNTSLK
jgi:hypothetical protein